MGISAIVKEWYIKTIPGMNSKVEDFDLKDKWVEAAQNCRFENEPGALDKREPSSFLNTVVLGGTYDVETGTGTGLGDPVVGVYRYYPVSGVPTWVAVSGETAYQITDAGVSTPIRTSLTDGKRCSFVTYQDLLYVGNAFDDIWVWDGDTTNNVTWEMGSCKALLASSGTALDLSSTYNYRITFDQDAVVNGATSNTVTTTGSISNIDLSNIPLGPDGTTDRKIYRTQGSAPGTWYLVHYIGDNTTTTWPDSITDAQIIANTDALGHGTIGDLYPAITDDMPLGNILTSHRERLFITGNLNEPNKIFYSNVYLPHYIQQTTNLDYMEISPDDGDEIMGIPIQLERMVCIKKNSIRKLQITSAVSGSDPQTWYAEDPIAWIGSPAQWSITQSPNGVIFLGWDHWYLFDGASAQPVFDEFDTGDILPANFIDVVGFFHKENFLAAYTDKTSGSAKHNRVLVYNLKREALCYDLWTNDDNIVTGANCFASRSGDDEVGDLYLGDSVNGFVLKEKDTNSFYRLRTKTEANDYFNEGASGSVDVDETHDVYVGGTENEPYIEIGNAVASDPIPDDIVIFWDNEGNDPGSGWTEITGNEGKLLKIDSTPGTSDAGTSHRHLLTGSIPQWFGTTTNLGDGNPNAVASHTHNVSANSDSETPIPRHVKYRMFKKNSSTTEYEFPDGALVFWDQATAPAGWIISSDVGYYLTQGTSGLGTKISSTHDHTFTNIPTGTAQGQLAQSDSGDLGPRYGHNHTITGVISTETLDTWEVNYVAMALIKKVGETSSWDGTSKYCYALFASTTAASNGWSDDTSTYSGRFVKIGDGAPTTGAAANASHTHTAGTFTTSTESATWGNGGYHATGYAAPHTHQVTLTAGSASVGTPPSVTFRIYKKILGLMRPYNDADTVNYTNATWVAPPAQIDADTLLQMKWNEALDGTDDITLHTRTGATQAACEAASWSAGLSNPNGSDIASAANIWLQYKIEFTASGTATGDKNNPRIFFADGYVVIYEYHGGVVVAEDSVNFRYRIGLRNFNMPSMDKIFKKVISRHVGTTGSFNIYWETENASGTFVIPLDTYPTQWDSYFPSTAYGKEINFEIQKNDLHSFKVSEIKGLFSPHRTII